MRTLMMAGALALATLTASVAHAEDAGKSTAVGPGSVFDYKQDPASVDDGGEDGDYEITTDLSFYLERGYKSPDYETFYNLSKKVAADLIIPDYVKRTGKLPPDAPLLQIASVHLTSGDFNDLLVYSNLPGDCDGTGCLVQIYRTRDAKTWTKVVEFKAMAFAYKELPDMQPGTEIVAVGNADVPSRLFDWNGLTFVEK